MNGEQDEVDERERKEGGRRRKRMDEVEERLKKKKKRKENTATQICRQHSYLTTWLPSAVNRFVWSIG